LGRGTGLGLAVVHGIVEEHKGHIKLYSAEGEGTTVHLYFPKVEIDDEAVEQLEADEPLQGGNEKVMLIDDEPGIIASESSLLSEYGYQVTSFTDAQEAFKVFKDTPDAWNIVITDMTMPQMTGSQLAQEIFKLRPNFPIVLCTGFSKLISKDTSEGMGIAAYLQKPVEKSDLLRTIRQVLDKGTSNN
jgi:CheY-like chemotaxis protein